MPNWCSAACSIKGPRDDIDAFRQRHIQKMEDGEIGIDFNTVIPMPHGMLDCDVALYDALFALGEEFPPSGNIADLFRPSCPCLDTEKYKGITTRKQLLEWFVQNRPDDLVAAAGQIVWHRKTGFYDWFEWRCVKWGTQRNCHDFRERPSNNSFDFSFCTAWTPPIPVFDKLAGLHPSLTISLEYEELEWGGHLVYRDGTMVSHDTFESECDDPIEEVG